MISLPLQAVFPEDKYLRGPAWPIWIVEVLLPWESSNVRAVWVSSGRPLNVFGYARRPGLFEIDYARRPGVFAIIETY